MCSSGVGGDQPIEWGQMRVRAGVDSSCFFQATAAAHRWARMRWTE